MAQFFSTGGGQGQQVEDSELRFLEEEHVKYIQKVSKDTTSFEMLVTAHMRMSGVYWGTAAMALLGRDLGTEMDSNAIVEWIFSCQYENGGFGGNVGHDPHMLYTLSTYTLYTGYYSDMIYDSSRGAGCQRVTASRMADADPRQ